MVEVSTDKVDAEVLPRSRLWHGHQDHGRGRRGRRRRQASLPRSTRTAALRRRWRSRQPNPGASVCGKRLRPAAAGPATSAGLKSPFSQTMRPTRRMTKSSGAIAKRWVRLGRARPRREATRIDSPADHADTGVIHAFADQSAARAFEAGDEQIRSGAHKSGALRARAHALPPRTDLSRPAGR